MRMVLRLMAELSNAWMADLKDFLVWAEQQLCPTTAWGSDADGFAAYG